MDYEKAYKEALERAKEIKSKILYSHLSTESCKVVSEYIDTIIPELAESEDERIRKKIIEVIRMVSGPDCDVYLSEEGQAACLAWLEKQKEINTEGDFARGYDCGYEACLNSRGAEFFEKQKEQTPCGCVNVESEYDKGWRAGHKAGLKDAEEQKPAEWSEEDKKMLDEVLDRVTYAFYEQGLDGEIEDDPVFLWLHKLRPSWKPSEEQIAALYTAAREAPIIKENGNYLYDLYDQLKSL